MFKGNVLRVGTGIAMLAAAAILMAPHLTHHMSRNAVVNAPVIVIAAPFDGRFVSPPLMPGTVVLAGRPAFEVEAAEGVRLERVRLEAESSRLSAEVRALDAEVATLDALDASLQSRDTEVREVLARVLALRQDAVAAERRAAATRLALATEEAERTRRLAERGTLSSIEADRAIAEVGALEAELDRLDAEAERLALELGAAQDGALGEWPSADGTYARQRRDEIAIRRADLVANRERLVAAREAVERIIAQFGRDRDLFERFSPILDGDMVAWTPSPSRGAAVSAGAELIRFVDCSRRFIEVPITERAFDGIAVGDVAEVWLKGAREPINARVAAVRGAGSVAPRGSLAAAPVELAQGMLSVLLDLPAQNAGDEDSARRFCDIGRSAQVKLRRDMAAAFGPAARDVYVTSALAARNLVTTADWLMQQIRQAVHDA